MKKIVYRIWFKGANFLFNERLISFLFIQHLSFISRISKEKKRNLIIWGNTPVINIKYWSQAIAKSGYKSVTLVPFFGDLINKKKDYDLYFDDVLPSVIKKNKLLTALFYQQIEWSKKYFALKYIINNACIYHMYFDGGPLGKTRYWKREIELLKKSGVKIIATGYGSDVYVYSKIFDLSIRHILSNYYPDQAKSEKQIEEQVSFVNKHCDVVVGGFITDGRSKWDLLLSNPLCINTDQWKAKSEYSMSDGINGVVKVIHLSNHRAYTGTEFIINAINELKQEGLKIDFFHPEKRIKNDDFLEKLQNCDLVIDAIIFSGYGLAAIESMASGVPAIVNLESENLLRVFKRYSFLSECPLPSATPETIKKAIKILVTQPELRKSMGILSRKYVEKYHSEKTTQFWFNEVYKKIIENKEVDLFTIFHPMIDGSYNNINSKINSPEIIKIYYELLNK